MEVLHVYYLQGLLKAYHFPQELLGIPGTFIDQKTYKIDSFEKWNSH